MQPVLVKDPFDHPEWLYEPKWDGYRALCFVENDRIRFVSRNNEDLTKRFPELQRIKVDADQCLLDGEIVALDKNGAPCFEGLRGKLRPQCEVVYYAFDLLQLNGEDFRSLPLIVRKGWLSKILPKIQTGRLRATEYVIGDGLALFAELEKLKLEGMVAKKLDSVYVSGRSKYWKKIKTQYGREAMRKRQGTWK